MEEQRKSRGETEEEQEQRRGRPGAEEEQRRETLGLREGEGEHKPGDSRVASAPEPDTESNVVLEAAAERLAARMVASQPVASKTAIIAKAAVAAMPSTKP